ncbi:unnamed protein product [Diatraea saccharalis]|uniref:Peroxisomal membrane protein 11B n=1 Tax=Diatraea saccharalis TaxID=40085 RepID=A0A9N9RF80_9NEOP|nr:unnamed protein product [Diatraea saccharalis]
MDILIKVNEQSNGRDKIARLFQYTSRLVWHQLETRNANKYSVDRIKTLEVTLSSFRKSKSYISRCVHYINTCSMMCSFVSVLRLGRCVDMCYVVLNSTLIDDPILRLTLSTSKLAHALFLYADHVVWLARNGFVKSDSDKWNRTANKFWLLSIIANLIRDLYEILHLIQLNKSNLFKPSELISSSIKGFNVLASAKHVCMLVNCHKDIFIDTLKNSCDLFIPLTALGITKLSPSIVGTLGAISSLAALMTVIMPITKLVPA